MFTIEFYFTDRQFRPLGIVSTSGKSIIKISDDEEVESENGRISLKMTLHFSPEETAIVKKMAELGNFVVYQHEDGDQIFATIMEKTHDPLNGTHEIVCEDAGLDLLNEVVGVLKPASPQKISWYINSTLADAGFTIHKNEVSNLTRTIHFDSDQTALERLNSICSEFGCMFKLWFEFDNLEVTNKYIDIVKELGEEKDITLRVGKNVNNIVVSGNVYDLMTAVKPFGGTPENSETPISLYGYKWTDPDGRFKVDSTTGTVIDTQESAKWSRVFNSTRGLHTRVMSYETTDKAKLVALAIQTLEQYSTPAINYDVDCIITDEDIKIQDTVFIVDENEELYLSGKILTITRSRTENSVVITLGDFLVQEDNMNQKLIDLANKLEQQLNASTPLVVSIASSQQFFVNGQGSITLTASVKKGALNVTDAFTTFTWSRKDANGVVDTTWNASGRAVTVTSGSKRLYTYYCKVESGDT